ncbi:MAG TPA: methyl-accepting chemotaxis protein [Acidimicrobiia bacterium]|nr:methyl-accepting chemotaxis protein [Acidimicrobiia bacterium]
MAGKSNGRWRLSRKLALLCAVAGVAGLLVAVVAISGISSMNDELERVVSANDGQKAMAEVDASHDNVMSDTLMVLRADTSEQTRDAQALLKDDSTTIVEQVREAIDANVSPAITAAARALLPETQKFVAQAKATAATAGLGDAATDAAFVSFKKLFDEFTPKVDALTEQIQKAAAASAQDSKDSASSTKSMIVVAIGFGIVGLLLVAWRITRAVTRPLARSVESLDALARKDLTRTLEVTTSDETAVMAASFNSATTKLKAAFEQIARSSETLDDASQSLMTVAAQLGSTAAETSAQSSVASTAGEEVARSVDTVATAVEELTASISEIAENAADAATVAAEAVELASVANANVLRLGDSSREISGVVQLIQSIAEQTNLLALNATIEAARAGEAGKGFAVVANEVKELATATGKATEEIAGQVDAIQTDTESAVRSIGEIAEIVDRIKAIQTTIASSVEEQAATTSEIGQNVADAARGTSEIAENVHGVARAAESTAAGVGTARQAAEELRSMADELKSLVHEFTY